MIFEHVRWNACVHRLDLGLYSHAKEFLGNGVRTHVNSKGKSPLLEVHRRVEPALLHHNVIIIAFKGAIRDFFTISSQRRELSPTCTLKWPGRNSVQITCNTSSVYHMQVSCFVPLGAKGQLSY